MLKVLFIVAALLCFNGHSYSQAPSESTTESAPAETATDDESLLSLDLTEKLDLESELARVEDYYGELISAAGINNSTAQALLISVLSVLIFLSLKWLSKVATLKLDQYFIQLKTSPVKKESYTDSSASFYKKLLDILLSMLLFLTCLEVVLNQWQDSIPWLQNVSLIKPITVIFSILIVVILAIIVLESAYRVIDQFFEQHNQNSARVATIKPIAKNCVSGALLFIFGMLSLSQLGIDIAPLLAGAGVVGIAVGFGAQAIVKDVLTGIIIILEDLIQVGDVVTLQGRTGAIEKITIRKVQLRDLDGTVYTVPFGDVDIVANLTKLFSFYLMDVGVAYRENVDDVCGLLQQLSDEMRQDEQYQALILDDIEILGVDQFADSAVIIKARIKTLPKKQWVVGREFNRRMKHAFDARDIEIPFPHQTLYIGQDKQGNTPALPIALQHNRDVTTAANDQGTSE